MTSKLIVLCLLALGLSNPAQAAKFKRISKLTNPKIEALARFAATIKTKVDPDAECSFATRYSFTRKVTELDISTIKQLNIAKAGIWHDNEETSSLVPANRNHKKIIDTLTENITLEGENDDVINPVKEKLLRLIGPARDGGKLYEASHADEDGSWKVLDVLDSDAREVLLIRVGFCGT